LIKWCLGFTNYLKNFMMENKSSKKLITHNGSFHSDDIFAAATLSLMLEKNNENFEIIRTRDEEIIKTGDYVFDVGGIYDEEKNLFDHHQVGGAGKRSNGIEYAACGLVWKKFGIEICGSQKVSDMIDERLFAPVDAGDNGFDLVENKYDISPYLIQHAFSSMRPTWREENVTDDGMFLKCVEIAKEILSREIIQAKDGVLAREIIISTYEKTSDKRIIVLDKNYSFEYSLNDFPEPLFIISPRRNTDNWWTVKAVREDPKTFVNRKNFPKSWAGLRDEELVNVSGVPDAVFCHRGLFLAVAKSKEGAIKLAQIAVES
jgi:uncharacterized UPF0160 family protein